MPKRIFISASFETPAIQGKGFTETCKALSFLVGQEGIEPPTN